MPITVAWDDEARTTIAFTYEGHWGWEEFYESVEQSNTLMGSVSHPVDVIINLQNSFLMPQNMLSHLARMPKIAHPNTSSIVVVGANSLVHALSNLFIRLYGNNDRKFRIVRTLEDGRQFLKS
ncbi:MAG: hypothetical protein K8J31_14965 [Anaerolineae bacterium]|nr:hypothetical protein [Anaerolineae bacterium]